MLSKLSTLILGILSEQERNPYEITKMLNELKTREWLPLADSTVYATINSLKKKELILGRSEKTGTLPEKTIYSITPRGEFELMESVTNFLAEDDNSPSNFEIGILLMHNLSKDQILVKLKKKLERLEGNAYLIRKQVYKLEREQGSVAFTSLTMLKHKLHVLEAEIKTIQELIKELNIRSSVTELSPFDMRMF